MKLKIQGHIVQTRWLLLRRSWRTVDGGERIGVPGSLERTQRCAVVATLPAYLLLLYEERELPSGEV